MTTRFRSAFSGSSGFVAARPLARLVGTVHVGRQDVVALPARQKACQNTSGQAKAA